MAIRFFLVIVVSIFLTVLANIGVTQYRIFKSTTNWGNEFKTTFIESCIEQAPVGYCTCMAWKMEQRGLVPTYYNTATTTEEQELRRIKIKVEDYLRSEQGLADVNSCL